MALSGLGYGRLAGLRAWSQAGDVWAFLATMAVLFALYGVSVWALAGSRRASRYGTLVILGTAALFRLALVPAGAPDGWMDVASDLARGPDDAPTYESYLLYDNDVWRYFWDGRVMLGGVDTFRLSPLEIEELADDGDARFEWFDQEAWAALHPRIGYASYRTVYPPLAQVFFMLSTWLSPAGVAAWKLLLIAFDLATCWLLIDLARRFGRGASDPTWLAAIYAWNPMVIKELAGSAHVDALLIFFLVLAVWALDRGRERASLLALGGAILIKLTPILLIPLFAKRIHWRNWWVLPSVGAVAYAPFLGSLVAMTESLGAFAKDWAFNAGPWGAVLWMSQALGVEGRGVADAFSLLATLLVVGWVTWSDRGDSRRMAWGVGVVLGAYVLLSPTVMPWYLLWALPFLAVGSTGRLGGRFFWPVVTAASLCSYGIYIDGVERFSWLATEFALISLAAILSIAALRRSGLRTCDREAL